MDIDIDYLRRCVVLFKGQIHRFGIICVLEPDYSYPEINQDLSDDKLGHYPAYWHPKLHRAAKKGWVAFLSGEDDLQLRDPVLNRRVGSIPLTELRQLSYTDVDKIFITRSGYGIYSIISGKQPESRALTKALAGTDPKHYDNGHFVRVDPHQYAGKTLALIRLLDNTPLVYTQKGEPVRVLADDQPLAFARWNRP